MTGILSDVYVCFSAQESWKGSWSLKKGVPKYWQIGHNSNEWRLNCNRIMSIHPQRRSVSNIYSSESMYIYIYWCTADTFIGDLHIALFYGKLLEIMFENKSYIGFREVWKLSLNRNRIHFWSCLSRSAVLSLYYLHVYIHLDFPVTSLIYSFIWCHNLLTTDYSMGEKNLVSWTAKRPLPSTQWI